MLFLNKLPISFEEYFSCRLALSAATFNNPCMFVSRVCIDEVLLPVDTIGFISSSLDGAVLEDFVSSLTAAERSLLVNFDAKRSDKVVKILRT